MAKSERRSKWKRKFRAIKREKNSVKELESLKKVLKNDRVTIENIMKENSEKPATEKEEESTMEVEGGGTGKKYNSKTMLDENGHYPVWMNQRAIKKIKRTRKRLDANKNKKLRKIKK